MPDDKQNPSAYRGDLAYIHNAGFGMLAENAAVELLRRLARQKLPQGRVVDLGCGGGLLSLPVAQAGYDLVGYDLSPAMIQQARQRVPSGDFHVGSFLDVELPPAVAVTAVGEIFCYLFDRRNAARGLGPLFKRLARALVPGGVLLFDVATPGRVPPGGTRTFRAGDNWLCAFTAEEDSARRRLTRQITTFVRAGDDWRRDDETHELRLFDPAEILSALRQAGLRAQRLKAYGDFPLMRGLVAFAATKPRPVRGESAAARPRAGL